MCSLTEIDFKILDMLAKGYSYNIIADILNVKWEYINRLHRKHFPT